MAVGVTRGVESFLALFHQVWLALVRGDRHAGSLRSQCLVAALLRITSRLLGRALWFPDRATMAIFVILVPSSLGKS